ncbi:DUF4296 domain-containing protein [Cardinium endosymbiont of Bemisia tabaci]|uniref:DUF4296 domain-containing protein n=1 Tax=Candidatus Cardinium TaxID=273135 RepID=UPI000442D08F|nr:DUF4296 domain-containing protein [Cardinium endosymbiont of Bemisia tabaci]CDG49639.1 Hypothetical protein CHV_a0324 [Cardinium endosymbiont cBtQ1 of Bemisia tabaci]
MKKITSILFALLLLYWIRNAPFTRASTIHPSTSIVNELVFVNMIRDLELLNSWLLNSYYPQGTISILRLENQEKILALYRVDAQSFNQSIKYYLEDSSERALEVYRKVYQALKELSI